MNLIKLEEIIDSLFAIRHLTSFGSNPELIGVIDRALCAIVKSRGDFRLPLIDGIIECNRNDKQMGFTERLELLKVLACETDTALRVCDYLIGVLENETGSYDIIGAVEALISITRRFASERCISSLICSRLLELIVVKLDNYYNSSSEKDFWSFCNSLGLAMGIILRAAESMVQISVLRKIFASITSARESRLSLLAAAAALPYCFGAISSQVRRIFYFC